MQDLLSQFGINWTLLVAQMVNFAILVWVLSRFVYKPVIRILDERRERIENSLAQAKTTEIKSREAEAELAAKMAEAKNEAAAIIAQAKEASVVLQKQASDRVVKDAAQFLEQARKQAETERAQMMADFQTSVVQTSLVIVEKLLKDKGEVGG
jgi:F-type H+-transporting ATPase subunit b